MAGAPQPDPATVTAEGPARRYLHQMLATLVEFKALPKYQFERRVDIFLVPFLPDILRTVLNVEGPIELVAPEFPLKRASNNQSTNADYLLFDHTPGKERWILFELKTDDRSLSATQMEAYRRAMEVGMPQLARDVHQIRKASKQGRKYARLVERLEGYPTDRPLHLVYLSPGALDHELQGANEHSITFDDLLALELEGEVWSWVRSTVVRACATP